MQVCLGFYNLLDSVWDRVPRHWFWSVDMISRTSNDDLEIDLWYKSGLPGGEFDGNNVQVEYD